MFKKYYLKILSIIILGVFSFLLIFLSNPQFLKAEESSNSDIVLKKLNTDEFPKIVFFIDFKEGSKLGSVELKKENLKILEDKNEIKNFIIEKIDTVKEPVGVVLLLDTSGSMKGAPIEAAKAATLFFIDQMRKIDKFAIVGFSDEIKIYSPFTKDREQLKNSIAQVEAKGETSLFDGLDISIDQFKDLGIKYKYIVVLSDGMDTVSKLKLQDNITKALKENITVFSIAILSKDFNPNDLSKISADTGGELLTAANTTELKNLYTEISRKIRNQYKISYTSFWPNVKTINTDVSIEESGLRDSVTLSYTNPYYAPQPTEIIKENSVYYLKYMSIWWVRLMVYAAIFLSVIMFLYTLILMIFRPKQVLKEKTEIYGSKVHGTVIMEEETSQKKGSPGLFKKLSNITSKVASKRGFVELFDLKLERAGLKIRGSEFMTLQIISILLIGILIQFFLKNYLITIIVILLLVLIPLMVINSLISKRVQKFDEQLPDTLQLISGALKAGYSFNQAVSMVVNETKPPITDEFQRILNEIRIGLPEKEALENSSNRIGSSHFAWVVMAINVQREAGGNLAEIMGIIANTIRERAKVMNQIKALTAEGRLSAIILIALPIFLGAILFTINRAYVSILFTNIFGIIMVIVSAVLMIIGIIWIIKIINVKY